MTRHLPIYILLCALSALLCPLAACTADDAEAPAGGRLTLVLNISDTPAASRADDTPGVEKIHTLRIVLARPDGTVEANRLILPDQAGVSVDDLVFGIEADPWKTVYLIANEASAGIDAGTVAEVAMGALADPSGHPRDIVSTLVGDVPEGSPLPMTAVYRIATSAEYARPDAEGRLTVEYDLHMMRTMAKFTFNIANRRNIPVSISSLGITGIQAPHHWLFPRVADSSAREVVHYITASGKNVTESGTGMPPEGNAAPPGTDWFLDRYRASARGYGSRTFIEGTVTLPPGEAPLSLDFYQCESLPPQDADPAKPYSLVIGFDGNTFTAPLDNLPSLPRNTHVVVNVTFGNNDKILEIEVLPYYGVDLFPSFGQ